LNFDFFGGRRFIATIGAGAVTAFLCYAGKIDGGVYSSVIIATVAAYIAGNVTERHINANKAKEDAEKRD